MPLPNIGMDAVPFTPITSQWGDDIIENIESLADGSGLADGSVTPSKLALAPAEAYVATSESTTSTSWVDLTTTTDTVTVTIGANGLALVNIYCQRYNTTGSGQSLMTFQASGANTIAASDLYMIGEVNQGSYQYNGGATHLLTGLTSGSTTFKLKYRRQTAGTAYFFQRRISVVPL